MQILFISPYEHHSNILPWLELGAEVRIKLDVGYDFTFGNFVLTVFRTDVSVRPPSFNRIRFKQFNKGKEKDLQQLEDF